jgi:PAS domain S-box-containing protein
VAIKTPPLRGSISIKIFSLRQTLTPFSLLSMRRYVMAAFLVLIALGLSLQLHPYLSDAFLIFFLAAVMAAGWFGRTGPGLFSVAISTVFVDYFFILPHHALAMNLEGIPYFLSFLLSAVCASWLASTRKQAEEKQRVYFDKLFDQSPEAIMLVDSRDRVQRINGEFSRIFGYTSDEIVDGISLSFIVPPFLYDEAMESRTKLSQGESVNMETVRRCKNGSVVHVSEIAIPVAIDGERVSYYYIFRDISESKRAAEALQRAHAELVHLSRVTTIGELVTSIAHEVNQPITAVVTNGNAAMRWLAQQPPNLGETREALGNIVRDATRAGDVIGRIRTLVQKGMPQMAPLAINEVIRSVLNILDAEFRREEVRVRMDLAEVPFTIGDRVQLQQVMLNLIINAIDAMETIPERPGILDIRSMTDGDFILVQVHDRGMGMTSDQVDRMFDPFFTTKQEGVGMGLTISRSIIDAHGGRLWATPGESGMVLNFTLPIAGRNDETI